MANANKQGHHAVPQIIAAKGVNGCRAADSASSSQRVTHDAWLHAPLREVYMIALAWSIPPDEN
jgi:hypothetical protein